jgi:hypothetical protein
MSSGSWSLACIGFRLAVVQKLRTPHTSARFIYEHKRALQLKGQKWLAKHPKTAKVLGYVVQGVSIVVSVFLPGSGTLVYAAWQMGIAAASSATQTYIAGGSGSDMFKSALIGAGTSAAGAYVNANVLHGLQGGSTGYMAAGATNVGGKYLLHVAGHGLVGGAISAAQGGSFRDGFIASAVTAAASPITNQIGASLNLGTPGTGSRTQVLGRTLLAGAVGGTASALGGGKFANGFVTAAMQHLMNAERSSLMKVIAGNPSEYLVDLVYNKRTGTLGAYMSEAEWVVFGDAGDWRSGLPDILDQNMKPGGPTPDGLYRVYSRDMGSQWANTPGYRGYAIDRWDNQPGNDRIDSGAGLGRSELRIHAGMNYPRASMGCVVSDTAYESFDSYMVNITKNQTVVGGPLLHPYSFGGSAKSNIYYGTLHVGSW